MTLYSFRFVFFLDPSTPKTLATYLSLPWCTGSKNDKGLVPARSGDNKPAGILGNGHGPGQPVPDVFNAVVRALQKQLTIKEFHGLNLACPFIF